MNRSVNNEKTGGYSIILGSHRKEINYTSNAIRFDVKGTQKTIVPIMVEIAHK